MQNVRSSEDDWRRNKARVCSPGLIVFFNVQSVYDYND
ncbi:unnamed protein product [Arabidopsis halleri]